MKHLVPCLMTLLFLPSAASAACIDDLRKVAEKSFAFNEATKVEGKEQRSTEGNVFEIYFNKTDEDLTVKEVREPNNKDSGGDVVAIRSNVYGEGGQSHYRISFLNKNDFVIRNIDVEYDGRLFYPRGTEILKVITTDYLFCSGVLQVPKDVTEGIASAEYKEGAENSRTLFFNAPELAPYLNRIKP